MGAALCLSPSLRGAAAERISPDARLFVSYALKPDPQAVLAHDLCILNPAADVPLIEGRAMGHTHLAYISALEVTSGTEAAHMAASRKVPLVSSKARGEAPVLNVTRPGWEEWLVEDMVRPAIEKGFDGVVLDTLDSVSRIVAQQPSLAPACQKALVSAVERIRRDFPGKRIVLDGALRLAEKLSGVIDGVMVEGVYQTWSAEDKTYTPTGIETSELLLSHISRIQAKKLPILIVDPVMPANVSLAQGTARRIRALGCIPFITTPGMQGEELAPLREVPRRIAVLHGDQSKDNPHSSLPASTLAAELLQGPLEWLGYEIEYIDAGKGTPPDLSPLRFRGIVIDEDLHLLADRETAFADWLIDQRRHGLKLLFTGSMPFTRDEAIRRIFRELTLTGGNRPVAFDGPASITSPDRSMISKDAPVSSSVTGAHAVVAPRDAKVMLKIQGRDRKGGNQSIDPVFLTSWGGALLLRHLPEQSYHGMDIHAFVTSWIGTTKPFPAPDSTTRDGMRAFYSHFNGDGFTSRSAINSNPLCAEVIRDRLLKTYPLPVTVSVIEADIEAQVSGQDPLAAPHSREVARSIFALPNVQPGSHTYSHPLRWPDRDPAADEKGSSQNLELKPWANYSTGIDVSREVRGSVEYMNRVLVPASKQVEILLWSGDCRPGADALKLCRELHIENMNGGATSSPRFPGLVGSPPSHTFRDGEIQIYAAHQNEFQCAKERQAPFFESPENVITGFQRTDSPRRLKPVNLSGDFHDASYVSSINAMEKLFAWSAEQPLHAITAKQYAQMVRDAGTTILYESGPGRWLISNAGHLRTFRLPATIDDPDIAASNGVTGWVRQGDWLYVHTRGQPVTELVVDAKPAPHLRLAQCSAEIAFDRLEATRAEFRVADFRPVQASFAGAPPHAPCELVVNGQPRRLQSDSKGMVTLSLPATANVTLDFSAAHLANRN
jgi:hypothetical protein